MSWWCDPNGGPTPRGNRLEDCGGVGIHDAMPGSFILSENTSAELRGPGTFLLGPLRQFNLNARQVRPLSWRAGPALPGDALEVSVNAAYTVGNSGPRQTFRLTLKVADTLVDQRSVTLDFGQSARVILSGTAPTAGELTLPIERD